MAAGWICADVPPCPSAEQLGHQLQPSQPPKTAMRSMHHAPTSSQFGRSLFHLFASFWLQPKTTCVLTIANRSPSPFFGSVRLLRWLTGLLVQPWRNATETFWSSPTFRPWPGNGIFVGNRTLVYISCLWNVSASNLGENWDFCRSYWQHMAN